MTREVLQQALHALEIAQPVQPDNISKLYEELRSIIDGGSEVFTHADAVQYLKDNLEPLKWTPEDMAYRPGGLAQPEPVAWHTEDHLTDRSATTYSKDMAYRWECKDWPITPLYTAPPKRQPLTDEQIQKLAASLMYTKLDYSLAFARAIEAAHGIGENT